MGWVWVNHFRELSVSFNEILQNNIWKRFKIKNVGEKTKRMVSMPMLGMRKESYWFKNKCHNHCPLDCFPLIRCLIPRSEMKAKPCKALVFRSPLLVIYCEFRAHWGINSIHKSCVHLKVNSLFKIKKKNLKVNSCISLLVRLTWFEPKLFGFWLLRVKDV